MDAISLPAATLFIQLLGLPGLVFIIWHYDNKRDQRKDALRNKEIAERERAVSLILTQYKDDVAEIKKLYENNAGLVKDYNKIYLRQEHLYTETISIISLNTQTQTKLVENIKNNMFCPIIRREKGPQI